MTIPPGQRGPAVAPDDRVRELLDQGDVRAAATAAIQTHGPAALRYLRGITRSETEAREAFSLFSERAWRNLDSFRGACALQTWMLRVAWSAASDLRKSKWNLHARRLGTSEAEAIPDQVGTSSHVRAERRRRAMEQARRSLSIEDQALLQLRVDQGLSWADCAEVLALEGRSIAAGALMKRFERIKAKLARVVARA